MKRLGRKCALTLAVTMVASSIYANSPADRRVGSTQDVKGVDAITAPMPRATGGPDDFGYVFTDSTEPGGPTFSFVDLSTSGTATSIALDDDDSANVPIGFSFSFYGTSQTTADVDSNGYLTFGGGTGDFSNDCPFSLNQPMIAPHWDDLDPGDDGALAYYETFGSCPVGDPGQCFIVQWEEFDLFPGDGTPGGTGGTFQAVLHANGEIRFQYQGGPGLNGASATIGISQDAAANSLQYSCNSADVSGGLAILYGLGDIGDLEIVKTTPDGVVEGGPFDYEITVTNLGPEGQTNVTVTDVLDPSLSFVGDDCGGSFAADTWTWNIGNLANGASTTCNLSVQINGGTCVAVSNTASVTGDAADPVGNSSSSTTNGGGNLVQDPGFEGGTPNADWAETSTNFGTPLCDAGCGLGGGTGPRTGDWWAWFGGVPAGPEEGSATQDITIPVGSNTLEFWLEQPACDSASDFMEITIDGTQVFLTDGSAAACGNVGYVQQMVDISAFADGGTHTLQFRSETFANNAGATNFFVDDVAISSAPTCTESPDVPVTEIPTLDSLGLIALVLLLSGFGIFAMRRRF